MWVQIKHLDEIPKQLYCHFCGAEMPSLSKNCPSCGTAKIKAMLDYEPTAPKKKAKGYRDKTVYVLIFLMLVVINPVLAIIILVVIIVPILVYKGLKGEFTVHDQSKIDYKSAKKFEEERMARERRYIR
jgi:hypothetical protein